jgi:RNA polymerase sigma-70 factor (ECF subfamily)
MKGGKQSRAVCMSEPNEQSEIAQLYQDTSDELRRLLVRKLGNHQEADEIAQDAYLKLCRIRRDEKTDIRDLRKYLFTMSVHLALNVLRKRRNANNYLIHEQALREEVGLAAEGTSLYRELLAEQQLEAVKGALTKLPDKTRYIFLLHRFEGLTYAEISRKVGLSGKAVEYHMKRALEQVMAAVDEFAVPEI